MKKFFQNLNFKGVLIGLIIGAFVSLFIFSALVPSGVDMIRVYNMKRYYNMRNNDVVVNHMMGNQYMMDGGITSEKEFVEEMIKHHEAAVIMSQEVLKLNPRAKVKKLAEDIISAQTSEINMMKEWLKNWK